MKFNYGLKISLSFLIISLFVSINKVSEFFYNISLSEKSDFFLTLASINSTFFAIFFSIILIAMQHSASNYLPSILNNIRKDSKLIFIIVISTLGTLFSLFIYLSENYSLTLLAIILFLLNFLAIIFYFYEVLNFVNPLFILEKIKEKIIRKMKENKNKTLEKVEKDINGNPLQNFSPLVYLAKLNSKEYFKENITFVDELFNHVERSRANNDPETYKKSLESIFYVVDFYLLNKEMDSQQDMFISHVLTKLNLQADFLLSNNEHFKITEIINTLEKIAISSLKNLKIIGRTNYLTALCCYYITEIGKQSIIIKNLDLTKESLASLKKIGIESINENLSTNIVENNIKEISALSNSWFIYNSSLDSINTLLDYLIENIPKKKNMRKFMVDQNDLRTLIKVQGEILKLALNVKNDLEITGAISPLLGFLSKVRLSRIVYRILWMSKNSPVEMATHNYEKISKSSIERLLNEQEPIIKLAKKINSNIILIDYPRELLETLVLLNKTKLVTFNDGFKKEAELAIKLILECNEENSGLHLLEQAINNLIIELNKDKKENKDTIDQLKKILKNLGAKNETAN